MTNFLQDIRYALRTFRGNLPTNAVVVLVLAMGIGSSTAIFSIGYRLLQPLAVPHPERIMRIGGAGSMPGRDSVAYWSQGDAFAAMARFRTGAASLRTEETDRVAAAIVSAGFFDVLEIRPRIGRAFSRDDEEAGGDRVAVISDALWRSRFGGSSDVLGETIYLDTLPFTVVGVMPPGARFPGRTDIWAIRQGPGASLYEISRNRAAEEVPDVFRGSTMIGRLNQGVTQAKAQTVMEVLLDRSKSENTDPRRSIGDKIFVRPLRDLLVKDYRPTLVVLAVAVGLLLLIACATAANVLLSRLARRQGEMAVRIVLGAGRVRVGRQFLTEASVMAGAAGLLGVVITAGLVEVFRTFAAGSLPGVADLRVDLPVLGFTLLLSVLTALACALSMMWAVGDTTLAGSLKGESGRPVAALGRRLRHAMVVGQIALALVLLTTAGVMVKSLDRLTSIEPGFTPDGAFTVEALLPKTQYAPLGMTGDHAPLFASRAASAYRDVETALAAIPGVSSVGSVSRLPLSGEGWGGLWFQLDDERGAIGLYSDCTNDYFRVMGIPLLAGRSFSDRDGPAAPKVVVISETLAHKYWGDESPLGETLVIEEPREIIGVVGDIKFKGLGDDAEPQMYFPVSQPYRTAIPIAMSVVFRGPADAATIIDELKRRVPAAHGVSFFRARAVEDVIAGSVAPMRFRGVVFTMFAVAALLLAMLAVYGAVANSVVTRTHEIGLRMSVGARSWDILTLFVGQGGRLGLLGVALGIAGALAMERLTSSLLFGIDPLDPVTLLAAIPFVLAVLLITAALPAWRASRLDPAQTLRHE